MSRDLRNRGLWAFVAFTAVAAFMAGLAAGVFVGKWRAGIVQGTAQGDAKSVVRVETFYDTIRHETPRAVQERQTGLVTARELAARRALTAVSASASGEGKAALADTTAYTVADILPDDWAGAGADSVLAFPIVQRLYEDRDYRAWVSGVEPRLDSIQVFREREVVTLRERPGRWCLGLSAGAALTPRGLDPFVGISITYSLITF